MSERGVIRTGEGEIATSWGLGTIMPSHPLSNFEIQKCYQNEHKFSDVYSRNNLPKVKDVAYIIILDWYKSIGTHWIALHENGDNITYFDSFLLEYNEKFIGKKNIIKNFYRIQENDSILWFYLG